MEKPVSFYVHAGGKEYHCVLTMGALLDYADATGKELHEAKTGNEILRAIYMCAAAGASLAHADFNISFDLFRHSMSVNEGAEAITAYTKALIDGGTESSQEDTAEGSKKKTRPRPMTS